MASSALVKLHHRGAVQWPRSRTPVVSSLKTISMPVPDFQTLMLPVLAAVGATESIPLRALRETLAVKFALSPEDLAQLLPSGRQTTFANRVARAA